MHARREWQTFFPLLREILNPGRPKPIDLLLLLFVAMRLVPQETRRWLRASLTKKRQTWDEGGAQPR